MNGIGAYGGMDAGSVIVAALERGFHKETMLDWTAHLANMGKDPTMKIFLAFILKKAAELDEEDTPLRTHPNNHTLLCLGLSTLDGSHLERRCSTHGNKESVIFVMMLIMCCSNA